jgi:3-phenylpropionate/cinnamic acid dioxygenase small subunit
MERALIIAGVLALATATGAAAQPASTAVRLQRLEDTEAIRNLLVDYGRTLDRRDFHAYAALFAKDGAWDGGFGKGVGPAAIEAMMRKNMGGELIEGPQRNFHVLTNFRIEVEGDHGTAWSRWSFVNQGADGKMQIMYAGRYEDQLVREDGSWKFKLRHVVGDAPGQAPPPPPAK